ncbi:hypothetical protein ACQPXH_29520 [Nocardia sp. CA-135953]|uniref:hypothetical protein n=1 Tax=Nocardia sp. CA-135953 TaxID=3239978 RepID=UPI003D99B4F5
MTVSDLPHRVPFVGPPRPEFRGWWQPPPAEVIAQLGIAISELDFRADPEESSRCRGVESSGTGDYEPPTWVPNGAQ